MKRKSFCFLILFIISLTAFFCSCSGGNAESSVEKSASESAKETPFDIIGELTGPAKENISHFLNGDITEIKITDYCVDSGDPPEYVLSDGAKIKEFANLLSQESWSAEDDDVYTAEKFISTKFELKNKQDGCGYQSDDLDGGRLRRCGNKRRITHGKLPNFRKNLF